MVAPDGSTLPAITARGKVDSVLAKALARAFQWQKLLDNRTYSSIKELAAKENVDQSYVGDVLRLTLLAPDIIEMILDGRQPLGIQFEQLRGSLPSQWGQQRELLKAPRIAPEFP